MIAYLRGEAGGSIVRSALRSRTSDCFAHALNLCEVYYDIDRSDGHREAERALGELLLDVSAREETTVPFIRAVGELKAIHRRISLADCCGLTLARELDGQLFTADRHELESLAAKGDYRIHFIR